MHTVIVIGRFELTFDDFATAQRYAVRFASRYGYREVVLD